MSTALRKMRIIAIPLTRPNQRIFTPIPGKPSRLTYYQFQISQPRLKAPSEASKGDEAANQSSGKTKTGWMPEGGVVNWASRKAADTWAGFGKAKGGWKLKAFQLGERLADRIDFEELALKSIDPSFGPSITQLKGSSVLDEKNQPQTISLLYPPSILSPSNALSDLRDYTAHRIPQHRKGFYFWMIIAPFTAPFMIIPIIPNLPFFFCVWRSWSHYKAYRSSQYLQSLLEHDLISPEEDSNLDGVYDKFPSSPSSSSSSPTSNDPQPSTEPTAEPPQPPKEKEPHHHLLLNKDAVPPIMSLYELGSSPSAELYRALEQATIRVKEGRVGV